MLELKQFWQWLKGLWRRLWGSPPLPQPTPPPRVMTDADYERTFMQLLEEVEREAPDWQVRGFVLSNLILGEKWMVWLRGFGERLLETSTRHGELARRMVRLGELDVGEVGEAAAEIGRELLAAESEETDGEAMEEEEDEREDVDVRAREWFDRAQEKRKEEDFQGALESYDKALEIQPDYYEAWNRRGALLCDELHRYEEALASFETALTIKPDYHKAWPGRGVALSKLGKLSEAIASFDKALAIKPDYHYAWDGRGITLSKLGELSEAIASYDKALAIQPGYSNAWNNRGALLCDKLHRYPEAIASFDKVLVIKPDNHLAWYNRGVALSGSGKLLEALMSYEKALANQPGYHEAWNNRGILLCDDLRQYQEAIASFDKALAIKPNFHLAWINRGVAVGKAVSYNPIAAEILQAQFPDSPPVTLNPQLTRCGYEGKLLCYQEGLKHCPADTHPEGYGELHREIGRTHYSRGKYDYRQRQSLYAKAVSSYNRALSTLTAKAYPQLHLETLRELIKVLLGLGQTAEAQQLQRDGTDLLRRLVADEKRSQESKQQLALKFADFQQLSVDTFVQSGQWREAWEAAEAGKNACLSWLLYALADELPECSYAGVAPLLREDRAIVYWHLSPIALTAFVLKHGEERPLVVSSGVLTDTAADSTDEAPLERRAENERLIQFEEWLEKWNQLYGDYREGKKQERTGATWVEELPEMLRRLKIILDIEAIETAVGEVKELVLIPHRDLHRLPLHSLFGDGFVISCLPSAQFGLLAADVEADVADELMASDEAVTTEQSPSPTNNPSATSAYNTAANQSPSPTNHPSATSAYNTAANSVFTIENPHSLSEIDGEKPLETLYAAELESAYIRHLLSNNKKLAGDSVTKAEVAAELSNPWDYFHFSGHGTYDFKQPRKSALCLTGTERLRVEDLVKMNLENYRLVCLSACETAVTGSETITTEYVGLVSAFLSRGVDRVVSTLWTVRSDATALITMQFYRLLLLENIPPVEALNLATRWLRDLTAGDLVKWYEMVRSELPKDEEIMRPFLRSALRRTQKKEATEKVYWHPYYWAAFIISGIGE